MKWTDSMREELLTEYRRVFEMLGEEEFSRQFEEIKRKCHSAVEFSSRQGRSAMGEAIALSSPSGHMSKRARKNAEKRLHKLLFEQEEIEHNDLCKCEDCELEKAYYINLICSNVEEESEMDIPFYIDPMTVDLQIVRMCSYLDTKLVENSVPSKFDCPLCEARIGETHASTCAHGERYAQAKEIRDAARNLGKLGGKSKSESKTLSSRENGKKGGRPRDETLNVDDI